MLGKSVKKIKRMFGFRDAGYAWSLNDQYVKTAPDDQHAVDIFSGRWSSFLPKNVISGGEARLFDDERIHWMLERLGDITNWRVLELGPLEAGHTAMIEHAGAGDITAVEANKVAYLKCLIVKEMLGLHAKFLLGDFDRLLDQQHERSDLIIASGVLYHMKDPLVTIKNMMKLSSNIFIWSHFFDEEAMPPGDKRREPFTGKNTLRQVDGDELTYHERSYRSRTSLPKFCGGLYSEAVWIERIQLIDLFHRHGYKTELAFVDPDHIYGPSACVLATSHSCVNVD